MGQRRATINSCSFVRISLPLSTGLLHKADFEIHGFGLIDTAVLVGYGFGHTGIAGFGRTGTVVPSRIDR